MARMDRWQLVVALSLALGLLAGCEQKGPIGKAGEKVDKAVEEAGKKAKEVTK